MGPEPYASNLEHAESLPIVEIRPQPPRPDLQHLGVRVVGPGRQELRYRDRIGQLERELAALERLEDGLEQLDRAERELELSRLVERGTGRLLDRVERELDLERAELREVRSQGHRLMTLIGGLQAENERLRAEVSRSTALAPPRRPFWRRLLGR